MTLHEQIREAARPFMENHTLFRLCAKKGLARPTVYRVMRGEATMYSAETMVDALGLVITVREANEQDG